MRVTKTTTTTWMCAPIWECGARKNKRDVKFIPTSCCCRLLFPKLNWLGWFIRKIHNINGSKFEYAAINLGKKCICKLIKSNDYLNSSIIGTINLDFGSATSGTFDNKFQSETRNVFDLISLSINPDCEKSLFRILVSEILNSVCICAY